MSMSLTPSGADAVAYNKRVVLASTVTVLIISTGSYVLRLCARRKSGQKFQWDDYMMGLALPFSYIPAVCLLYGEPPNIILPVNMEYRPDILIGLTVGLGEHVSSVSKSDLKKFNIVSDGPY